MSMVALKDGGNILDLGCGRGEIAYQGAKHGFKAVGLDYSAEAIALAKDNLSKAPHPEKITLSTWSEMQPTSN